MIIKKSTSQLNIRNNTSQLSIRKKSSTQKVENKRFIGRLNITRDLKWNKQNEKKIKLKN